MTSQRRIKEISLDEVVPSQLNVRDLKDAKKGLDSLKESMRRISLIEPIVVVLRDGKYRLIVGQRRWLAAKELGWKTIPAIVLATIKKRDAVIISAIENLQRRKLTFQDEVKIANYLFDEFKVMGKDVHREVAKQLTISEDRALGLLSIRMVPSEVAKMVDKHEISRKDANRVVNAAYPNKRKMIKLATEMRRLTTPERRRIVGIAMESPEASPSKWIDRAKKPPKGVMYSVILLTKWAERLEDAAKKREEDPEETAQKAIMEWLDQEGFA